MNEMRLRNSKLDVTGRSLILNIVAIVINLIGLVLIVKGFHESTVNGQFSLRLVGGLLMTVGIILMVLLKGMFLFSYVARAIVGGLFIVSGLVKANDPWGFAFKLDEYFEPGGLTYDFPFFEHFTEFTLELSIIISVVEIVLGAAVILGGKIKLTSWLLVLMMLFFTGLTWYTHWCSVTELLALETGEEFSRQCVTDCGCFGDALRGSVGRSLTPFESFWKDLVLFYFCLIIFINQWKIKLNTVKENWLMVPASILVIVFFSWVFGWFFPVLFALIALLGAFVVGNLSLGKLGKAWKMAIYVCAVSLLFSLYTANYLPIKDYRPYAIGNNLKDQMTNGIPEEAEFLLEYENLQTGEIEKFELDQWEVYGDTSKYKYHDRVKNVIVAGRPASISDFTARINYEDLSEEDMQNPYIDSLVTAEYYAYYEEKVELESVYGIEVIPAMEYDTIYYPDTTYKKLRTFVDLIEPTNPFGIDLTDYILREDFVFLMTIRDINSINEKSIADFIEVYEGAKTNNIPFFILSPATNDEIAAFREKFNLNATFLGIDGVEVKILVRSNPGLLLLKKAVVLDKWPSRSVQDFDDIYNDYIKN
ncbi:DoxX family protein [Crocinitomix algicola]|uniref:DoxX family protein n=1 Tax=Crocinitomix algicola TaxID=1740263 RepID=UPI00082E9482|nr:DoxX family protein [Crocinitomix algicola]